MNELQTQIMVDPETEFLASKQETGNEWELYKENVRPLKRGRNVTILNNALRSHTDNQLKISLIETRRKLIEAIDEYRGDDPLQPWIECIKWVQEAFPHGGDSSGLVVIYEQCVRKFWHSDRYKDDLRYLKVWLEYAANCADSEVVYSFLDANEIGKTHAGYYLSYAKLLESQSKMKAANEIFNLGLSRNAEPIEKLQDAYKKFLERSIRKPNATDEDSKESHLPVRSFGTVLTRDENGRRMIDSSDISRNKLKQEGVQRTPFQVYKDTCVNTISQPDKRRADLNSWQTLGARAERSKENNAIPAKWTTFKVPQRSGARNRGATASACIEVFVDDECAETHKTSGEDKGSTFQLREVDGQDIKKETELLRVNPLRNFPPNRLPR